MMVNWKEVLFCGGVALLGCNGQRDLGSDSGWVDLPEESASTNASVVYDNHREHVFGLALKDANLFALVEHNDDDQLVSCPVARCRSERSVLAHGAMLAGQHGGWMPVPLLVVGEHLVWYVRLESLIATCPLTGCDEPTFVESGVMDGEVEGMAGDDDSVYWTESVEQSSLWRLRLGEPSARLVRTLPSRPTGHVRAHEDLVYYTTEDGIYRVPKDGSADAELLVRDAQIDGMAAGEDALYYTTRMLAGRFVCCPWSSGSCDSASLLAGQRFPTTVRQSGKALLWINFPTWGADASTGWLSVCTLPGCNDVRQLAGGLPFPGTRQLAVSGRVAVWAEPRAHEGSPNSGSSIRSLSW